MERSIHSGRFVFVENLARSGQMQKGPYLYEVRKVFGFFLPHPPLVAYIVTQLISLLSAFWGPPPHIQCADVV